MANLRIAELDFDQIKTNLKNYLQSQTEFTDYDFEGSGLAVLLDILAYNTHYNAYLANMVVNEMFLDSAVKRSSAVSIAKHLGYTPRSARGAKAIVDITVTSPSGSPTTLSLPKYTPFSSTINGTGYTFVNLNELTTAPVSGNYIFSDVELVQGTPLSYSYTVVTPGPTEKYVIPNDNIDTTTISVTVQNSNADITTTTYTRADDISEVDSTSKVYFLQENPQERYEIYFGDGITGKKLTAGNIVTIRYLVTDGEPANTSSNITQSFTASSTIGGSSNITIAVTQNSTGGAAKEGLESIKFNAPLVNAAKNRAVTAEDYRALISSQFTDAESVAVWGGEDNVPPYYGKVLISLKPFSGFVISQSTKDQIVSTILNNKRVLAIQPEFIDPEYFYVNIRAAIKYNPNLTSYSSDQIKSLVTSTINTYFSTDLGKHNRSFYSSKLNNLIYETDPSIISASLDIKLQRRIEPVLNSVNVYSGDSSIKFDNRIHPNELISSYFYVSFDGTNTLAYFGDVPDDTPPNYDGTGTIKLYNASTRAIINSSYGTINYATGEVSLPGLNVVAFQTGLSTIRISGNLQEESYDITASRNRILVLDDSTDYTSAGIFKGLDVTVSAIVE